MNPKERFVPGVKKTMRKKLRRLATLLGVLLGLAVGGYFSAPRLARRYIEKHYAGVTVGNVDIHWFRLGATLHDVEVNRPNLQAKLQTVEVDRHKNVSVIGGFLTITVGEGAKEDGATSSVVDVKATDLDATVRYKDVTVNLVRAWVNKEEICFESGKVSHPKVKAVLGDGCVKRDKTFARISQAEVSIELPFAIPKVDKSQTVTILGLEVEPKNKLVRFAQAYAGPNDAFAICPTRPSKSTCSASAKFSDTVLVDLPEIHVIHPWIATYPVSFEKMQIEAPLSLLKGEPGDVQVKLGAAAFRVNPVDKAISGKAPCGVWLDALPKPLPEPMWGMAKNFNGDLSFEVRTKPAKLDIKSTCRFDCKARPISYILNKFKFQYTIYNSKNEMVERDVGPAVAGWASLLNLPPYVSQAFVLLEDPDFHTHRGVLPQALENSLKANLEKGEFFKGGSTITMQLAKNLWLRRHKTLARKAEEMLLAFALESCLSKVQILELYLNVIEFGPDLYGIGPAARHYFHKDATALTPEEAFYLASILPAPRKALPPEAGGLAKAKRIMLGLAHSGFISEYMIHDDKPLDTTGWETD